MPVSARVFIVGCLISFVACAEDFESGYSQTFSYECPSRQPVVFGGLSKAEDAKASEYCLWLDVYYSNGEASWSNKVFFHPGSYDWERVCSVFKPKHPVSKVTVYALYRNGPKEPAQGGSVKFRGVYVRRPEGEGEEVELCRLDNRPYSNHEDRNVLVFRGEDVLREHRLVTRRDVPTSPVPPGTVRIWTADSMSLVTPLTFPDKASSPTVELSLARRERESAQILISTAADVEWTSAEIRLPELKSASGAGFRGTLNWQRQGYIGREAGANPHPHAFPADEKWFPDPLLPPKPMRVRSASTQGVWLTAFADADAQPGVYTGAVAVLEKGIERGRVPLTVRVYDFSLPRKFGLDTAFSLMDGFIRAIYPDEFKLRKREAMDMMLDHRLNPDDISRTTLPDIDDLVYARERGMSRFNILNVVPPPKDPRSRCVLVASTREIFNEAFYSYFVDTVRPYVERLREKGLDELAYIYGFDERPAEYYAGMEDFWRRFQRDVGPIPLMTTAFNYRDYAAGRSDLKGVLAGDWHCPQTSCYDRRVSERLRAMGKKVWWYVCCEPHYPHANFASWEYPPIEGRLLGWMTWRWRADGLLFWIVNKWSGDDRLSDSDTYFPDFRTYNAFGMPGDGILMYPGENGIFPSIKLAQCRDAVEDFEYLQLVAARRGQACSDAACDALIRSLTDFTRDPRAIRAMRERLASAIRAQDLL